MPFSFKSLSIPEVILVEPKVYPDDRGYFLESFKSSDFLLNNIPNYFVQDNLSFSKKNVIRGMHFQKKPKEQGKCGTKVRRRLRHGCDYFVRWKRDSFKRRDCIKAKTND